MGADLAGAAFLGAGFSSSDELSELESFATFLGAFLAGATATGLAGAFLGAGFSSSEEESDELLTTFLAAAFTGAATGLAGAFLGAGFSSSEDESEELLTTFFGAALTGAAFVGTTFFTGFSSELESSELLLATFLAGALTTGLDFFFPASEDTLLAPLARFPASDEALLAALALLTSYTFSTELELSESEDETCFFVGLVFPIVVFV